MIVRVVGLAVAAVALFVGGLVSTWTASEGFRRAWQGPTSVLAEDIEAWQRERALIALFSDVAGPLMGAGLFCAVGAVLILAIAQGRREAARQRASASATAS